MADDRVIISAAGGRVRVEAPESIAGKLEVRGLGIMDVPFLRSADLVLFVELVASGAVERLPDPPPRREVLGHSLPLLQLCPFEASAPSSCCWPSRDGSNAGQTPRNMTPLSTCAPAEHL